MSARRSLAIGLLVTVLAVAGWRVLRPHADSTSSAVAGDVSAMLATTTRAAFVAAAASLDAQRNATGSYAGTHLAGDIKLVRADATSYCFETHVGTLLEHEAGPGGSPEPGPC